MDREIDWNTFDKLVFFGLRVVERSRRRKGEEIRLGELELTKERLRKRNDVTGILLSLGQSIVRSAVDVTRYCISFGFVGNTFLVLNFSLRAILGGKNNFVLCRFFFHQILFTFQVILLYDIIIIIIFALFLFYYYTSLQCIHFVSRRSRVEHFFRVSISISISYRELRFVRLRFYQIPEPGHYPNILQERIVISTCRVQSTKRIREHPWNFVSSFRSLWAALEYKEVFQRRSTNSPKFKATSLFRETLFPPNFSLSFFFFFFVGILKSP